MSRQAPFIFLEFFSGGGMAGIGLGPGWTCRFANDIDQAKADAYAANFGDDHLKRANVWDLDASDVPGGADLAWASSPCQDLSLAGLRRGLDGERSSAFWGFWRLIEQLDRQGRAPRAIVIENVTGLVTSHGGKDFAALLAALAERGYCFGPLEIDAARFLPQSRPRLFVLAVRGRPPAELVGGPGEFHTPAIRQAFERLSPALRAGWLWWRLPPPAVRNTALADLLEPDGAVDWFAPERTQRLVGQMAPVHRRKLQAAQASGARQIGTLFRRTRHEAGQRVQRAEARFDGVAGCLRTPAGGSSRQFLLVVEGDEVRARLVTPREAARLMGLPDDYRLPRAASAGLHVMGDGVAAPVVRPLAAHLIEPFLHFEARASAA